VSLNQRSSRGGIVVLPRVLTRCLRGATAVLTVTIAVVAFAGCGSLLLTAPPAPVSSAAPSEPEPSSSGLHERLDGATEAPTVVSTTRDAEDSGASEVVIAQAQPTPRDKEPESAPGSEEEDFDPWEPFNEKVFEFNRQADRFVLKPVARVYNVIIPEPFQLMIGNGFDNMSFVPRLVNSLLQAKWGGATRELSRFVINSTLGIGGLFDAAKYYGIEKSPEDFGQTLGVWGVSPGPYLIVPFLEPMTVRDGIGKAVDGAMNPLSYFSIVPFFWTGLALKLGEVVNDRALNLELFQGVEESVVDLYSAVRNGYLRRREQQIKE